MLRKYLHMHVRNDKRIPLNVAIKKWCLCAAQRMGSRGEMWPKQRDFRRDDDDTDSELEAYQFVDVKLAHAAAREAVSALKLPQIVSRRVRPYSS